MIRLTAAGGLGTISPCSFFGSWGELFFGDPILAVGVETYHLKQHTLCFTHNLYDVYTAN